MVQILRKFSLLVLLLPLTGAAQVLPVVYGGTGQTTTAGALANLLGNPAAGAYSIICTTSTNCAPGSLVTNLNGNTGAFIFNGPGVSQTGNTFTFSGSGTGIGSIAWALPSYMTASPTTISASGTQTFSFNNESANTAFMGPYSGSAAAPGWRAFVGADIPPINLAGSGNGGVTGTLPLGSGGTNATSAAVALANLLGNPLSGTYSVNCTSSTNCVPVTGGSSMVWPSAAGIANYNGSSAWGTSYSATNPIPVNFLPPCASATAGLAPASGGGTANFLRADCTWAVPPGSGGGSLPASQAYIGSNSGGAGIGVSPNNRGFNVVLDLGWDSSGGTDEASALTTLENYSSKCVGATITNCVPAELVWPAGYFLISSAHITGSQWRNQVWKCQGSASNYPSSGRTIIMVKPAAGADGIWFDPASAVFGSIKPEGCVFLNFNLYNPITEVFSSTPDTARSLLHYSNVNDIDGDSVEFAFELGSDFNPNSMAGSPLPTSGYSCTVTLNSYVATCSVPSGTSSATVAQFGQAFFIMNDVSGNGRPYVMEIYSASLSGTTLTLNLSTLFQHTTQTLYAWKIHYGGHGFLVDGFGQVRTANGTTGTTAGYSQYASSMRGMWSYCVYNPLDFSGAGVQNFLNGQPLDLYGTSRLSVDEGWFQGSCPGSANPMAPNGYIQDGVFAFVGGFTDTTRIIGTAGNKWAYGIISENTAHNVYWPQLEDTGTLVYSSACNEPIGSDSTPTGTFPTGACSRGMIVGGDLAAGSHAISNDLGGYCLGFGTCFEVLPTARQTRIEALIPGAENSTDTPPGLVNYEDFHFPTVGNPNCSSVTACYGLQDTQADFGGNIYKDHYVTTAPTVGGACTIPGLREVGPNGLTYHCAPSTLKWVQG